MDSINNDTFIKVTHQLVRAQSRKSNIYICFQPPFLFLPSISTAVRGESALWWDYRRTARSLTDESFCFALGLRADMWGRGGARTGAYADSTSEDTPILPFTHKARKKKSNINHKSERGLVAAFGADGMKYVISILGRKHRGFFSYVP